MSDKDLQVIQQLVEVLTQEEAGWEPEMLEEIRLLLGEGRVSEAAQVLLERGVVGIAN